MTRQRHSGKAGRSEPAEKEKPSTLRDLLRPEVVEGLKAKAGEWKADEQKREDERRRKAEEARKAEQERLENDFEHLLNNSKQDWRTFK